ncbi:ABC transporter substrate-binding protein [Roseobacteraceae bacterium S113]
MTGRVLNCGYVPLVDCAPLVIARELGFAAEEGLELNLLKQPSWSALRDMLAFGHLDAAHMLAPMPIAMALGVGSLQADVDVLQVLSVNGTVFGVSAEVAARMGALPFGDARAVLARLGEIDLPDGLRIGVPFHASMHALLLQYWLAAAPGVQADVVTVPPPRMADAVAQRQINAFWVGEPWGSLAVQRAQARLMMAGRHVWSFAPEKVLAARADWTRAHGDDVRRLMRAVYRAGKWLDMASNKPLAIEILAKSEHLDLPVDLIDPAISGELRVGPGREVHGVEHFQLFHKHAAQFPWRSQAAWIATQMGADGAGIARAKSSFRSDLFRQNLGEIGTDLPGASEKVEGAMVHATAVASSRGHMILGPDAFFDGKTFDFSQKTAQ